MTKETITRLDYFAAHAMQGLLATGSFSANTVGAAIIAREQAVALIEELKDYQPVVVTKDPVLHLKKRKHRDFVLLTTGEFNKLLDLFGANKTTGYIDNLNNYLGSTGKKYKSHYHTILAWQRKEGGSTVPEFEDQAELDKRWEEATK